MSKKLLFSLAIAMFVIFSPLQHTYAQSVLNISGQAFVDLNSNGVMDSGEGSLVGWQVYLDINQNDSLESSEPVTLTDSSGNFTFSGLLAGTYNVREVQQAGWIQTQPDFNQDFTHSVTLNLSSVNGLFFGNHEINSSSSGNGSGSGSGSGSTSGGGTTPSPSPSPSPGGGSTGGGGGSTSGGSSSGGGGTGGGGGGSVTIPAVPQVLGESTPEPNTEVLGESTLPLTGIPASAIYLLMFGSLLLVLISKMVIKFPTR